MDFDMTASRSNSPTIALHAIDIASPCTASWDAMKGNAQVRHCGDCNKNVFNLSAMPEAEAAALLATNTSGDLCVRFYRRSDGTVMTSDCSTSTRAQVHRTLRKLPGVAGVAVLAMAAANASAGAANAGTQANALIKQPDYRMATMGAPPVQPAHNLSVAPTVAPGVAGVKTETRVKMTMGKPMHSSSDSNKAQPATSEKKDLPAPKQAK